MQIHVGSKHLIADVAVALDVSGREHLVVVAKASWSIPEPGQRPRPLKPEPLVMSDQFYGEPGESALRYGSDFARFKPKCDVIFDTCAHAPDGKPVKQMDVAVQVGAMQKSIRVHGSRRWQRRLGITVMGEAEPFTTMPLHYGLAFGGTRWYDKGKERLCEALLTNPAGLGYAGSKTASQMHDEPAPNLEDPSHPVKSPSSKSLPHALGAIARHWSPRRELAGTYDDHWRDEVFPLLPADFDEAFHQVASTDQQIAYPIGGEVVVLKGLLRQAERLEFTLPSTRLFGEVQRTDDSTTAIDLRVDTLSFETERRRFSAIWRASLPLVRRLQEISAVGISGLERRPLSARRQAVAAGCPGCQSQSDVLLETDG